MTGRPSPIIDVRVLAEPVGSGGGLPEQPLSDVELVPPVDLFERTDRALQLGGALVEYTLQRPVPVSLLPGNADEIAARLCEAAAGVPLTAAVHRHRTPVGLRYHVFVRFADADAARAAMGGAGTLDEARLAGARTSR
jgi:hypothetical protein